MSAKPKRVFIGSLATETNTFSPLRTDLQDFKDSFYAHPGEHPVTPTLCSAIFTAARARCAQFNWQIIEGTATWAEPGGLLNQHTWEFLRDQMLREISDALPLDSVLLGLHGAMVAQECLDCEGELLKMIRRLVGPDVLIGVTFDPHSHLSSARTTNADIITVFKEFPHTDFVETAVQLAQLTHQTLNHRVVPKLSIFDCRMIEIFPTSREPMRGFIDRIKALETTPGILSISIIHGFMAGDVPDLGTRVLVVSDNDRELGDRVARKLGMELYGFRGKTRPEFLTPTEALNRADKVTRGPVVIADVWDNPGGGVAGDSTILLQAMIERKLTNSALASIWDPIAVRTCISAGENAQLKLRFGGKMSASGGDPIDAHVIVRKIQNSAVQSFGDSIVPLGASVWIELDGIDVILSTVRSQVFNPDIFINFGIDPIAKSLLVVKSTNHFQKAFSLIATEILYVAIDGPYPNDPITNKYENLKRDIWPRVKDPHHAGN